jgi:hypothetical protein
VRFVADDNIKCRQALLLRFLYNRNGLICRKHNDIAAFCFLQTAGGFNLLCYILDICRCGKGKVCNCCRDYIIAVFLAGF